MSRVITFSRFDIFCDGVLWWINGQPATMNVLERVAENDGLLLIDMLDWFKWPVTTVLDAQVICWDENINY